MCEIARLSFRANFTRQCTFLSRTCLAFHKTVNISVYITLLIKVILWSIFAAILFLFEELGLYIYGIFYTRIESNHSLLRRRSLSFTFDTSTIQNNL